MILTLDLGTSTTKAVVWDADGPRAMGRAPVETVYPAGDRAEQDPGSWWVSVVEACAEARGRLAGSPSRAVEAVGCAAARQTFVPVTAAGDPLGPALVWSDRRAAAEAEAMAAALGGAEAVRRRAPALSSTARRWRPRLPGWPAHDPDRLAAAALAAHPARPRRPGMTGERGDRRHHGLGRRAPRRLR